MKASSNTGGNNPDSSAPRAPISLTEEADRAGINVTERIKDRLTALFVVINLAIIVIIAGLALSDAVLLAKHLILPADRLISSTVVLRLIWCGAAQVGVIAVIIAKNVFRVRAIRNEPTPPHPRAERVASATHRALAKTQRPQQKLQQKRNSRSGQLRKHA